MSATLAVAYYSLLEMSRRKLLWVFTLGGAGLVIAVGLFFTIPELVSTQTGGNPNALADSGTRSVVIILVLNSIASLFAWFAALGISMTVIYNDFDGGTAVSIFTKPASRLAYTAGKLIAATVALILVVGVFALCSEVLLLLNGGEHQLELVHSFLYIGLNQLTQVLLVLVLTVVMNNIVAAVLAVGAVKVGQFVGVLYAITQQLGTEQFGTVRTIIVGLYWVLPRYLTSDLQTQLLTTRARTSGQTTVLGQLAPLATDYVYWAVYAALLMSILYGLIRRRQV